MKNNIKHIKNDYKPYLKNLYNNDNRSLSDIVMAVAKCDSIFGTCPLQYNTINTGKYQKRGIPWGIRATTILTRYQKQYTII